MVSVKTLKTTLHALSLLGLSACQNDDDQRSLGYIFVAKGTSQSITASSETQNGGSVYLGSVAETRKKVWKVLPIGWESYHLQNVATGKCLAISPESSSNGGAGLALDDCKRTPSQRWLVARNADDTYSISLQGSELYLGVGPECHKLGDGNRVVGVLDTGQGECTKVVVSASYGLDFEITEVEMEGACDHQDSECEIITTIDEDPGGDDGTSTDEDLSGDDGLSTDEDLSGDDGTSTDEDLGGDDGSSTDEDPGGDDGTPSDDTSGDSDSDDQDDPAGCDPDNWVTIDFETDGSQEGGELIPGQRVTDDYADSWGLTISARTRPDKNGAQNDRNDKNAIIFDTNNPTGGDSDLVTPGYGPGNNRNLGNVLIIAEGSSCTQFYENPDDEANGGWILFEFDNPVWVRSIDLLDMDAGEASEVYVQSADPSSPHEIIPVDPSLSGDNSLQALDLGNTLTSRVIVKLARSGAVDNLKFCIQPD